MPIATSGKKRGIHCHLNYKGDQTKNEDLQPGRIMGPTFLKEMMVVLKTEYNPETDMTRVGFDYARESDFLEFSLEGVELVDVD